MKTRTLCMIGLTGSTILLAACSGARDEDSSAADSKLSAPTLAPAYALGLQADITVKNNSTGALSTTTIKLLGKVAVTSQVSGNVAFNLNTCKLVLPKVGDYQPFINDSVLEGFAAVPYTGTVSETGALVAPVAPILFGVRNLTNPATDPLPTSGANVWDQDNDGKAGITVNVDTGILGTKHIFAGARLLAGFSGTVGADGKLVGAVSGGDFSQVVFGDDIPFIDVASMITEALAGSTIVKKDARFIAVPQAADLTCAQVRTLNPQAPATVTPPPEAPVTPEEPGTGTQTPVTETPAPTEG
jgi:hypothetical protein